MRDLFIQSRKALIRDSLRRAPECLVNYHPGMLSRAIRAFWLDCNQFPATFA
jgi:hypothetical protein